MIIAASKDGQMQLFQATVSNIRICRRGTAASYPVITDSNASFLPEPPEPKFSPVPDVAPDLSPLQNPVVLESTYPGDSLFF
ncbi:MAG: hypothetical protein ABIA63_00955 [bacterium]